VSGDFKQSICIHSTDLPRPGQQLREMEEGGGGGAGGRGTEKQTIGGGGSN